MQLLAQQIANGLALGAVYGLFAIGFALILAKMGILNVAHGTFATWGALSSYWLVAEHGVNFWLALVGGVVFAGLLGVATDQIAFEPLRRRGGGPFAPIISSIACVETAGAAGSIHQRPVSASGAAPSSASAAATSSV